MLLGHHAQHHTLHQALENEQWIYVSVDATTCDVSNNPDDEDLDESSPVRYHLATSPQFENVENLANVISSYWTSWVKHSTRYLSGEFVFAKFLIPNLICKRL